MAQGVAGIEEGLKSHVLVVRQSRSDGDDAGGGAADRFHGGLGQVEAAVASVGTSGR